MKKLIDSMVLGANHSLMISHTPSQIPLQAITDHYFESTKVSTTYENFGLFSPDVSYNTYFPDVTPDQFKPDEDEFIEPTFRLLTACIVAKNRMPTDFSKPGVLKNSMNLLVGQSVYCDHEDSVGNAIGAVKEVSWQAEYKDESGVVIPAGINGVLKIDGKANTRIARGINMDPPSIHSNSVTVEFEWEPSHQFKDMYEFFDKMGTYDDKGEMIRRIVTRIVSYKETSLVSHGADPFAQIIKDGKLNNPVYAGRQYYSFSEEMINKYELNNVSNRLDMLNYKDVKSFTSTMYNTSDFNTKGGQSQSLNNNKNQTDMNELEQFIQSMFSEGMLSLSEGQAPTMEMALAQVKDLVELRAAHEAKKNEIASLTENLTASKLEIASLKADIESLSTFANLGKEHLSDVRTKVEQSYRKVYDEKVDENIISLINADTTSLPTLLSLGKTYEQALNEKFPMKCSDCGSRKVDRSSSIVDVEEQITHHTRMSNSDVLGNLANRKRKETKE